MQRHITPEVSPPLGPATLCPLRRLTPAWRAVYNGAVVLDSMQVRMIEHRGGES